MPGLMCSVTCHVTCQQGKHEGVCSWTWRASDERIGTAEVQHCWPVKPYPNGNLADALVTTHPDAHINLGFFFFLQLAPYG